MLALIAVANIMIYLHDRPYGLRQHIVEHGAVNQAVTAVVVTVVDGRAYPLFAALFGYGLVRIADQQRLRGATVGQASAVVRRRSAWLLVFGLAHAAVGFSGDILGWYGLLGVLLAGRLHVSNRTLVAWAAGWLALAGLVQGFLYSDPRISDQRSYLWSFAIEDPVLALRWRLLEWVLTPVGLLAVVGPLLVGIWAGHRRILEDVGSYDLLLRRTAVLGVGAGIVGGVGVATAAVGWWVPPYPVLLGASWLHVVTGVLCGLGYAAALALLADWVSSRRVNSRRVNSRRAGPFAVILAAVRAAGERSLSCYLAQTVVFVALLPAWTLGWGAHLGTAEAAALALAVWLLTVVLAHQLAGRGRPGPAEALLRRLAYPSRGQATRATMR